MYVPALHCAFRTATALEDETIHCLREILRLNGRERLQYIPHLVCKLRAGEHCLHVCRDVSRKAFGCIDEKHQDSFSVSSSVICGHAA